MTRVHRVAVIATRSLFALAAALWLVVAVLVGSRSVSIGPVSARAAIVLAALMVVAALILASLARWSLRGNRLVDSAAVVAALLNVAFTLADQVGLYDVIYLVLSLALLFALLSSLLTARALRGPRNTGDV